MGMYDYFSGYCVCTINQSRTYMVTEEEEDFIISEDGDLLITET